MEELTTPVSPKVLRKYCPNVNCASNISCNMPECNRIDSLQNKHATILKRKDIKLLKKRYRDYILCNKVYSFIVLHFTIKFSYDNTSADTKIWSFHLGKLVRWSISHVGRMSPYVREPKTVLDSGLHAVDSGFQLLDSTRKIFLDSGFRIPKAKISRIPESIFPYMGRRMVQVLNQNLNQLPFWCSLLHLLIQNPLTFTSLNIKEPLRGK